MHVHRTASRLHHENVSAADVLLNLDIRFAVFEACDQSLAASQSKKRTNFVAERLIGGSAKDFEPVVDPGALRLAFRFLVRDRLLLDRRLLGSHLFGSRLFRRRNGSHRSVLSSWFSILRVGAPVS